MAKGWSFPPRILGKLDMYHQKNKVRPLPYTIGKNLLKIDQTVGVKTIKLFKNIEEKLYDIAFGKNVLEMPPNSKETSGKI